MLNVNIPHIPERTKKQRQSGITMVMDKGLSLQEAENFVESSGTFTDFIKFGFGTSLLCDKLTEKIKVYKQGNIKPYFGGTLFEAFIIRNKLDDYLRFVDKYKVETIEISDGSIQMSHDTKCELIRKLSKNYMVLSEVGSKDASVTLAPEKWVRMMKTELSAGSFKVIAEARESGNVGIYKSSGGADDKLIHKIASKVKPENIIWEAPLKSQAVWFVKLLGANVNLGNIATNEVVSTETIRLGLRGDTFFQFLPEKIYKKWK
ncbi:MAG: phosphosulfolactate synthase [Bacteroidia bacterium]|nr:phosphosulfolactate synthase [Bacteroidia bacterium]